MESNNNTLKSSLWGYGRVNVILLGISLLFILFGYILMSGGSSSDGVSFNESVFSVRRIVVAPILCTIGYLGIIPAILYRRRKSNSRLGE